MNNLPKDYYEKKKETLDKISKSFNQTKVIENNQEYFEYIFVEQNQDIRKKFWTKK